ncbi:hypothetical protein [Bradyrhizobium sp. SZCCHNS3053]|nr:hypothetical protein [Bradyrhizobium sp. SZCCHNS3053]
MTLLYVLIIAAALFFGLDSIADAMDNIAVGIEQAGNAIAGIDDEDEA